MDTEGPPPCDAAEHLHQELGVPAYLPVLGRILDPYRQDPEKDLEFFLSQFPHLEEALSLYSRLERLKGIMYRPFPARLRDSRSKCFKRLEPW